MLEVVLILNVMHKVNSRNSMKVEECRPLKESNGWNVSKTLENPSIVNWKWEMSTPLRIRLGPVTVNLKLRDVLIVAVIMAVVMATFIYSNHMSETKKRSIVHNLIVHKPALSAHSPYPLTKYIEVPHGKKYRIALITDLDHGSKVKDWLWKSLYLKGYLTVYNNRKFELQLDSNSVDLHSSFDQGRFSNNRAYDFFRCIYSIYIVFTINGYLSFCFVAVCKLL